MSVNAAFAQGVLDILILNDGRGTDAALLANGSDFFVDTNNSQLQENGEIGGRLGDLQQINVNGAAGIGTFAWRGDFTASNALQNLMVQNVSTATIDTTAILQNDASITAEASILFGGNLTINDDLTANATAINGQITNQANSSLHVLDIADLNGNQINLGMASGDYIQFGALNIHSNGSVQFTEDTSGIDLDPGTLIIGGNTFGSIDLTSAGSIEVSTNSVIDAVSFVRIQASGTDSDIQLNGQIHSSNGDVTLNAPDSIVFGAVGSVNVSSSGNVVLTANSDALNGDDADSITMSDGSLVQVDGGTILFVADNTSAGDITLSQLIAKNNAGTAIEIRALSNIVDGTTNETANLSATAGTILLLSNSGEIGVNSPLGDIDINASNLTANAMNGIAIETEIASLIANNSAIGGIFVREQNNIELTSITNAAGPVNVLSVSGNITIGSIVAGTTVSIATPAGSINDAQDDAFADVSAGGAITLTARNEIAGLAADGRLDLAAGSSVTATSTNGNIAIRGLGALTLTNVTTLAGPIDIVAQGTVSATLVNAGGVGSNTTIATTTGGIFVTNVRAENNVLLSAIAGDVASGNTTSTVGSVEITASQGDVTIGSIIAGTTVSIATPAGSINDGQDDAFADVSAGGAITLTARDEIAGLAVDGRLDLAAGSSVTATSTNGNIAIRGLGALTLTNVTTLAGPIDIVAQGPVSATLVNAGGVGSNTTIATTTGGIFVTNVRAENNVLLSAIAGDITSGNITSTVGFVEITASQGDVTIGSIIAGTTVSIATPTGSINDAQDDAFADVSAGGAITLTARDEIAGLAADGRLDLASGSSVTATSTNGNIAIRGLGALTLTNVTTLAGPIDIVAQGPVSATLVNTGGVGSNATIATTTGGIFVTNVRAENNVVLSAIAGDVTSGNITSSVGSVEITASQGDVTIGSIIAGTTVSIATPAGSINDAQDDAFADVSAGGAITLTARDEIAGLAADGRLDLASGSSVTATSTIGNIAIRGLGALTLTNVTAFSGAIDVLAQGTIIAVNVDASATDADRNDVTLVSVAEDILVETVRAGIQFGNAVLIAQNNIIDNDNSIDAIDIQARNVAITAINGNVGATSNDIFIENIVALEIVTSNDLYVKATNGRIAIDATFAGDITLDAITAWVQADESLNVANSIFGVTNLALIADANNDGVGELKLGNSLNVIGDLRVEGAAILATDRTVDLNANRIMIYSGTSQSLFVSATQLDATAKGNLAVEISGPTELIDLSSPFLGGVPRVDRDNIALQTLTDGGSILLNATGSILVSDDVIAGNDQSQTSTGSITLRATSTNADITIHDTVLSDGGSITIEAFRDIVVGGQASLNESTDSDNLVVITTTTGNIAIRADSDGTLNGNGGAISMTDGTRIIAGRELSGLYVPALDGSASPSSIVLGSLNQPTDLAKINLMADGAIRLGSLQSVSSSVDAIFIKSFNEAIIDSGDSTSDANLVARNPNAHVALEAVLGIGDANAIETNVYSIGASNSIGTTQSLSNGSIRIEEIASGNDLILTLVSNSARNGDIDIQVANGTLTSSKELVAQNGDIGLRSSQDVIVNDFIRATDGNVNLVAGDDIALNSNVFAGGAGNVRILAVNGSLDLQNGLSMAGGTIVKTADGDIVIVTMNNGDILLSKLNALSGNISLTAARWIDEVDLNSIITGNQLTIDAGAFAHLHSTNVNSLVATVHSNNVLHGFQKINDNANDRGDDLLNNVGGSSVENPDQYQFNKQFKREYALYVVNNQDLNVARIQSVGEHPNIYVETSGNSKLTVSGLISTSSSTSDEGGIVLVAGRELDLVGNGRLETNIATDAFRTQTVNRIGDGVAYLDARFFNGGEGIEINNPDKTSTRIVLDSSRETILQDFEHNRFQRVAMQFGYASEAGFLAILRYVDGKNQTFDVSGEQGVLNSNSNVQTPIASQLRSSPTDAAVFVREAYSDDFLNANQELPGHAVIRRSTDFFLFENGSAASSLDVRDLTFEESPIINVFSLGTERRAGNLPAELPPVIPPFIGNYVAPKPFDAPLSNIPVHIDWPAKIEANKIVQLYRVEYTDQDLDGQPDQNELPSPNEVLNKLIDSEKMSAIRSESGGTPTPEEIDAHKIQLQSDPEQASGVYAIVEIDPDGKEVVLEVFSVGDWDEKVKEDGDEIPIQPVKENGIEGEKQLPLKENSSFLFAPPQKMNDDRGLPEQENHQTNTTTSSRFANSCLLLGSLWILRQTNSHEQKVEEHETKEFSTVGFLGRDRLRRRLASKSKQ